MEFKKTGIVEVAEHSFYETGYEDLETVKENVKYGTKKNL